MTTDAIAEFCASHHDYNDISDGRRREQERILRALETYIAPRDWSQVHGSDLHDFLADQLAGGKAPSTVRKWLFAVRPFCTWAWNRKLITAEQLMELREVKAPRGASNHRPRPYQPKEVQRLWLDLDATYPWTRDGQPQKRAEMFVVRWQRGTSNWSRAQWYAKRLQVKAIIALALYGGLRRDEVFNLDLDGMHPDNDYVVVTGARKNKDAEPKERAVPWNAEEMRDDVAAWLAFRDLLAPAHDRPWLSLHQQHYLKAMRHRQFEMLLHDIGRGYEYHRLRHTCATELLRNGMPLEKVQRIMGHSRLEQTLKYAELLEGDVVKASARVEADFSRALAPRPELKEAA